MDLELGVEEAHSGQTVVLRLDIVGSVVQGIYGCVSFSLWIELPHQHEIDSYLPVKFGNALTTGITVEDLDEVSGAHRQDSGQWDVQFQAVDQRVAKVGLGNGSGHFRLI